MIRVASIRRGNMIVWSVPQVSFFTVLARGFSPVFQFQGFWHNLRNELVCREQKHLRAGMFVPPRFSHFEKYPGEGRLNSNAVYTNSTILWVRDYNVKTGDKIEGWNDYPFVGIHRDFLYGDTPPCMQWERK